MTKRNLIFIAIAVALAGIYVVYFTNWIKTNPNTIGIHSADRRGMVYFGFDRDYQLTELKVVLLADWQTNKLALPVWHLVSTDGSDPIRNFFYGRRIAGMNPAVEGSRPLRLQPGVVYRMLVTAGPLKGSHDFQISSPANR